MLTVLITCMLTLAFTIQPTEAEQFLHLSLDTDRDIYILGENVTITLTNISSETVNIGGYPAWGWGLSAYFEIVATKEQWVPYVPFSRMVDLKFWMLDGIPYIKVSITFSDGGFSISDWGTVVREGCEIWVDSKIWDWTGPSILVITRLSHTYNLGRLESGNYTFTFKAWGNNVKSINFTVTEIIPEFPPAIILPLFIILSVIAVIFAKRRTPRKPKN